MTQSKMTFSSDSFKTAIEGLSGRAANSATVASRMGLGDTSTSPTVNKLTNNATNNASQSERQGYANANEALANNPMFKQTQLNDARNFTEDVRRFDKGLGFKDTADQRANDTNRLQTNNQLAGVKYNADAGVTSTGLQADAQKYGADRGLDAARIGADANRYGADRGVDQARIGANAQVESSRLGADASRFNALLGAGTTFFNSSQYRPTFNR